MGLKDRPYWREEQQGGHGGRAMGAMTFGLPKPSPTVKILLILNITVFILQIFADQSPGRGDPGWMSAWFGVTVEGSWQIWRYITFQFLHGGVLHIFLNMLGLYFLGSPLERRFGRRWFTTFYLSCGVLAGIAYVLIGAIGELPHTMPIIGASGGVYGIVLAAAVYFPHFRLLFLFFPVPIRLAALVIFAGMILLVLRAGAAGHVVKAMSDVAHLGGAVAAAVWIWVLPRLGGQVRHRRDAANRGAWQRRIKDRRVRQEEIDRILDKIQREGIDSLTRKEKDKLREATIRQQREEREIYRP